MCSEKRTCFTTSERKKWVEERNKCSCFAFHMHTQNGQSLRKTCDVLVRFCALWGSACALFASLMEGTLHINM